MLHNMTSRQAADAYVFFGMIGWTLVWIVTGSEFYAAVVLLTLVYAWKVWANG